MECPPDKIILDPERGEYICTETGEVIEERIIDCRHEYRVFSQEDLEERARAEMINPLVLDGGIGTESKSERITRKTRLVRINKISRKNYLVYKSLLVITSQHKLPRYVIADAVSQLRGKSFSSIRYPHDEIAYTILFIVAKKYGIVLGRAPKFKLYSTIAKMINARHDPTKLAQGLLNLIKTNYNLNDEQYVSLLQFINKHKRETTNVYQYILALAFVWLKMNELETSVKKFGEKAGKKTETTIRKFVRKYISLKITCTNCNNVLFTYPENEIQHLGIPTPFQVVSFYDGQCPKCGTKLTKENIAYTIRTKP